jgi:hypothetical protein
MTPNVRQFLTFTQQAQTGGAATRFAPPPARRP